jgi:hypothetical protein
MADRSEGGGATMKVFVVMGNDFPDAVFSTVVLADQYVRAKQAEKPIRRPAPTMYWRVYEFTLDTEKAGWTAPSET